MNIRRESLCNLRWSRTGLTALAFLAALLAASYPGRALPTSAVNSDGKAAEKPGLAETERSHAGTSGAQQSGYAPLDLDAVFNRSVLPTGLLSLKVDLYLLQEMLPDSTAIMPVGDRILLGNAQGGFAEFDFNDGAPRTRPLPLRINLYEQELLDCAAGKGIVDHYLLRIHDLASLDDGRQFAVSYSRWDREKKCVSLFVSVNDLPADWSAIDPNGWRTVFESRPCISLQLDGGRLLIGWQAGGRIVQSAPGKIALTVGDFEYDGVNRKPIHPQDEGSDYGKVFEIDLETGAQTMLSLGHRNPQGLARDAKNRLWSTEHGPFGGDELNLIVPGSNYGWPWQTHGTNYDYQPWPLSARQGRHDNEAYRPPQYAWLPSIGVSNLIALEGFADEWDGDLLVASLSAQELRRLRVNDESVIYDEPIYMDDRLRDITQLDDGRIAIWTDADNLMLLEKNDGHGGDLDTRIAAIPLKIQSALKTCSQCHSLSTGVEDKIRIGLSGVYGRDIGAADPALYSDALKARQGKWDETALDAFLTNPDNWAPGTSMHFSGINDSEVRRGLIAFLRTLKDE